MNAEQISKIYTAPRYHSLVSFHTQSTEFMCVDLLGGFCVNESIPATTTAKNVFELIKQHWIADEQTKKINKLYEHIKKLENAGEELKQCLRYYRDNETKYIRQWNKAKKAKP